MFRSEFEDRPEIKQRRAESSGILRVFCCSEKEETDSGSGGKQSDGDLIGRPPEADRFGNRDDSCHTEPRAHQRRRIRMIPPIIFETAAVFSFSESRT